MSKFKKNSKRESGAISTASLPDIVFMLLFFFMVATVLRTEEEMVKVVRPEASEIYKIEKKHLIRYINIGPPQDKRYGTEPVIQLNDQFADVVQIRDWVENERLTLAEAEQTKMWVSMKVDQDTKMGVVTDVKQELQQGLRPEGAVLRELLATAPTDAPKAQLKSAEHLVGQNRRQLHIALFSPARHVRADLYLGVGQKPIPDGVVLSVDLFKGAGLLVKDVESSSEDIALVQCLQEVFGFQDGAPGGVEQYDGLAESGQEVAVHHPTCLCSEVAVKAHHIGFLSKGV